MAAVLASLVPTTSSHVYAQVTVYYNPYGQGPYSGYGPGYAAPYRAHAYVFQSPGGVFVSRTYGYPAYQSVPPVYGNRFDYGPPVQVYGRSAYYQPSYGPVYVPYGHRHY